MQPATVRPGSLATPAPPGDAALVPVPPAIANGVALEEVVRLKPSSAKGRYIQKGAVSTTFGPGIPLDVNSI